MAEAAAIGVLPHIFLDYTHRMLFLALKGETIRAKRRRREDLWHAWQTANLTRAKVLPALAALMQKLDPGVIMSAQQIRSAVFSMAQQMGAKITRKKKAS